MLIASSFYFRATCKPMSVPGSDGRYKLTGIVNSYDSNYELSITDDPH
jgi:hypothetical protein